MKRNLFRRNAALVMALALCAGGASATIADFAIEQPTVYATKHGTYYHYDPVCSGMKNAQATTADDALTEGKTACPVCIPAAGASVYVSEAPEEFASFAAGSN